MSFKMNTTELIINKAMNIASANHMDFPDYDETVPMTLADALTVIVTHDEEHDSELIGEDVFKLIDDSFEDEKVVYSITKRNENLREEGSSL
jgi:hypothetical protein